MKLIPLYYMCVIKKDTELKTSEGGIILTGGAQNKDTNKGTVMEVGEGRLLPDGTLRKLPVKPGDRVMFTRYAESHKVLVDGDTLILCADNDILCKIEE